MKNKINFFILLLLLIAVLVSCSSFFQEKDLCISSPENGTIYYLENCILKTKHCLKDSSLTFASQKITALYFIPDDINFTSGINVIPEISGTIFPFQSNLDIWGGFAAQIYIRLILQSEKKIEAYEYSQKFNWNKLINKIREYENPYELDMDKIICDIASRNFSAYSVKKKSSIVSQ